MEIKSEKINVPAGMSLILGHAHFIKTVEDLYEAMVNSSGTIQFGLAFNEAAGACLVRKEGNNEELTQLAVETARRIGAGHLFVICLREGFPINVLPSIREVREVAGVFCATANPVDVVIAETEQGRGVLGVVDGFSPRGVENDEDIRRRKERLRKFGYKR